MIFRLTSKKTEGKELILNVLATDGALTTKEVYNRLKARHGYKATYHAVYGLLAGLMDSKVLLKEGDKYRISPAWVDGVYEFLQRINGKKAKATEMKQAKVLSFATLEDADEYLKDFEKKFINEARGKDKVICWHCNHAWWNIIYSKDRHVALKNLKTKGIKLYLLLEGNTVLDRLVADSHRKVSMFAKTGVPVLTNMILGIYGPYIILMAIPHELMRGVEKFYSSVSKIENLNVNQFFENILNKKTRLPIKLIIYKNRREARELTKLITANFK